MGNKYDDETGQRIGNHVVRRVAPVPDLGLTCSFLEHEPTGAQHIHVGTTDDNNLFSVSLRTPPTDSTGVAHILEHTVLCGSKRYPVRDPFFSMIKRSLSTFMNALTSDDWTMYPFSSRNEKDFDNLLDVYLDAVFFPNLREMDFRQEGHRLQFAEPANPDSLLTRTGVVYNEMKGALSDPRSILGHRLMKTLFPTTTYGHNSGGDPETIPDLSWEGLKAFHGRYYHPSNARFFTYGHLPLERHLEVIEDRVLRHFKRQEVASAVTVEPAFSKPVVETDVYPVSAAEAGEDKSMVQVAWRTAPITDSYEVLCLRLLTSLLLGNPGAPLYRALLESGLGRQLAPGTGFSDENLDTIFAAGLQGVAADDTGKVEDLVLATLKKMAGTGFPPARVEAAIHRLEFGIREIRGDHFPYPLLLLFHTIGPWNHDGDPVAPLLVDEPLRRLRDDVAQGGFFEGLIRRALLENPHRVTLALHPDGGYTARKEQAEADGLAETRDALSDAEKAKIVRESESLRKEQEKMPDLSCLPRLGLSEIRMDENPPETRSADVGGRPVLWCPQQTNGISYAGLFFDTAGLPAALQPWVPFFATAIGGIGAAGQDWAAMAERIEAGTGGVNGGAEVLADVNELDRCRGIFSLRSRCLSAKRDEMFSILRDLCTAPDFSDLDRLHTLVGQVATSLENAIPQSGHRFAAGRAASALTASGRLAEVWSGLEYVRRMKELAARGRDAMPELSENLRALADHLLRAGELGLAVVGDEAEFPALEKSLESLLASLPGEPAAASSEGHAFSGAQRAEGWGASVSVSYVARAFRTVPYGHGDAAPLMVLSKLLRFSYLHREIREKGGAYGGMAAAGAGSGTFSMMSYRDPHLGRTLGVYRDAAKWAASGAFETQQVEEAILGVFGDLDAVLSPEGKGLREFRFQRQGIDPAMRRTLRERVLVVKKEDLVRVAARYLVEGFGDSAMAVISDEKRLKEERKDLPADDRYRLLEL